LIYASDESQIAVYSV